MADASAGVLDEATKQEEPVEAVAAAGSAAGKKKKKKGKKKKKKGPKAPEEKEAENEAEKGEILKALGGLNVNDDAAEGKADNIMTADKHKFWDTQPVPNLAEDTLKAEGAAIDNVKTQADIRQEPLALPKGFEWVSIDINDATEAEEVYTLLTENYVEDDDNMFRFDYSIGFLKWALTVPGFHKDWHVGLRQSNNGKLRAFITGIPAHVHAHGDEMPMAEINFLCVHKKLRKFRLAPVLIQEVTRRVNCLDVFQAVYTAGVLLPKPIASCRYHHRSINPKKLIEVGFSRVAPRMTMARTIRLYKLPEETKYPFVALEEKHIATARNLLVEYLTQFKIHCVFSEDEFRHWFLPRDGIMDTFVIEDKDGKVTDMCSYYHLPSSVIGNDKHATLYAAYSFYNIATTVPLTELMNDCLTLAKRGNFDVFNALDIMENGTFLKDLKFGIGDGHLQYYLYNWRCQPMVSPEVGLVLL